jgi:hypothetical protein
MRIEIIGGQEDTTRNLHDNMEKAVMHMELPAEVVLTTETVSSKPSGDIVNPAVAIDGKVVWKGKNLSPSECSKLLANYLVGI